MDHYELTFSLTGESGADCLKKIAEADRFGLDRVSLFLERLEPADRESVYAALRESGIKDIPLVHLRSDMSREEIVRLVADYGVRYFTIHENHFDVMDGWHGFEKQLYLEMSTDNRVAPNVLVEKIGGFCVDLAHYKKQSVLANQDWQYVYERRDQADLFACNHLSGYDPASNMDMHTVATEKDFSYLAELPPFVFGKLIAFEINNPLEEQMQYRDYVVSLLRNIKT